MSSFPSAIIKKKKKSEVPKTGKVNPSGLKGVEDYEKTELKDYKVKSSASPADFSSKVKYGGAMDFKSIELDNDEMEEMTRKVKPSPVPSSNKLKSSEDTLSLDLLLNSAKKKPDVNATSSEGEDFKVEKDKKGMWKESGAAKEKYLKTIGKLKKGK